MKKTILKKIFLIIISLVAIGFFVYFFWQYGYKSKASGGVNVNLTLSNISAKQNEEVNIPVALTTGDSNHKISAVDLYFKFDSDNKNLLEFSGIASEDYSVSPPESPYFDKIVLSKIERVDGAKNLRLVLVAKKPDNNLSGNILLTLRFTTNLEQGNTALSFLNGKSQIIGVGGEQGFTINYNESVTLVSINNQANCSQNSQCGNNAFCDSNNQCQCNTNTNYYNCDGNWNNGCESNQVCTNITNTPTPTPTPAGSSSNITLNLKLKFQGITQKPKDQYNKMKVKITAVSSASQDSKEVDFVAKDIDNNKKGIWEGTVSLNLVPGNGYRLLIKGPKHIQKKICVNNPTETHPGTYICNEGKITLNSGNNNLDFSNIYLLVGDLPDQNGVVNSYDLALVRNNLGKSDSEALRLADLNLDGRVNTQDYSLIMEALSVRADEE